MSFDVQREKQAHGTLLVRRKTACINTEKFTIYYTVKIVYYSLYGLLNGPNQTMVTLRKANAPHVQAVDIKGD